MICNPLGLSPFPFIRWTLSIPTQVYFHFSYNSKNLFFYFFFCTSSNSISLLRDVGSPSIASIGLRAHHILVSVLYVRIIFTIVLAGSPVVPYILVAVSLVFMRPFAILNPSNATPALSAAVLKLFTRADTGSDIGTFFSSRSTIPIERSLSFSSLDILLFAVDVASCICCICGVCT
jgi:hypothetical protein